MPKSYICYVHGFVNLVFICDLIGYVKIKVFTVIF
jgi:hypothetical protein